MVTLSVIIPAYNEAASVRDAIGDVIEHVFPVVGDAELIVVDDGSTDATASIVEDMAGKEPRLTLITQKNGGHGPALIRGLASAKGSVLMLLDCDRQIPLDGFAAHWALFQQEKLLALLCVRSPRNDPVHRLVVTRLMRSFIALMFGGAPLDGGAPYKIVTRDQWLEASELIAPKSWIPSVLLAVFLIRRYPDRIKELPIRHVARAHGQSTLNFRRLTRFCAAAAIEVVAFRAKLSGSKR